MYLKRTQRSDKLKNPENKVSDKVAVLGCGWLGLPLAEFLTKNGYFVNGSTTTSEKLKILESLGISPFLIRIDPFFKNDNVASFLKVNTLIINIPPSLRKNPPGYHIQQLKSICNAVGDLPEKVIFVSSTSVYPENEKRVNEESVVDSTHELVEAENLLREKWKLNLTILRCGGLMGYDRIPGKYFAGKKNISGGNNPVNYVHRDDVIAIIFNIIKNGMFGETFNVAAPQHPLKKDVCLKNAENFDYSLPDFLDEKASGYKIVDSSKLIRILEYDFKFPDPMTFYYKK